ncbi:MAG: hypothetical protein Ct9H300mP26_5450 [Acidimicrobiales bacterium]|nr:MAG: hypothetical protein Ct9H300mP26_5450 [Acidimicrobiales bacterium]
MPASGLSWRFLQQIETPNFFDRPDEVLIDREENRHSASVLGAPLPRFESRPIGNANRLRNVDGAISRLRIGRS